MDYLPDALSVVGLGLLLAGVGMAFGLPYALMVAGVVFVATGVALARARNRS